MSFPELIRSEEEILKRLLLVSRRQLELAQAGNGTALNQHLERRQQLWNEFELLEQQLASHKGISPEQRSWKTAEERKQTEAALNRCKTLLEEIMANDEQSLAEVAEQKDKAENDLRRIQLSANVAPAYMKQSRQQRG